ncbi:uncharacterized protein LOC131834293 isoform X8 [Mustela lutreola]|uniref:uncharacterized protein LOC131834293 isoform X8 n=1 Tax=Mustela lutreola TaxID=9666 RepID=UPI00279750E8|nr:uncharacterized protein LOC131834293 isoform X8 [Mustela lutreola]
MTKLSKMMLTALLIMVLFFLNQVTLEKVTRENEDHLEENGFQQEIGFYLLDDCHNLIINLLGGKLNTRLPGGRHNYILIGGKKSSRL